jgi:tetratricopeptide (TPR) repeat protein
MLMMSVVVYEDFGIRYNPNRITLPGKIDPNDRFFANAQDIFLNGLIEGQRMGTCSSMPVLYIAIGRRLGYPLKLVTTKAHLFVRWEDDKDRFDVEATGKGMNRYDDAHFKEWPFPVSDAEIQSEGFLKSLTASEELAVFLSLRGSCLKEAGRLKEAAECYAKASQFAPTWNAYRALLADAEASNIPLQTSKFATPPQNVGISESPGQTITAPDPNPLKQLGGE